MINQPTANIDSTLVASYWENQRLEAPETALRRAIESQGRSADALTIHDMDFLSSLDEFHCLGREATDDLARIVGVAPGAHVLDVGCGLGGPARRLTSVYGCEVVGVDITSGFLSIAEGVTKAMKLDSSIKFIQNDVTQIKIPGKSFDIAWMQVTAANIGDRFALYRNLYRLLTDTGRVAIFDIFQTPGSKLQYPVPWSYDGRTSSLLSESQTLNLAQACGFKCLTAVDVSSRAQHWFSEECRRMKRLRQGSPASTMMGLEMLLPLWYEMSVSQVNNLRSGALRFSYLVLSKM